MVITGNLDLGRRLTLLLINHDLPLLLISCYTSSEINASLFSRSLLSSTANPMDSTAFFNLIDLLSGILLHRGGCR